MQQDVKGSFAYKNWKMNLSGKQGQITYEFPLFTDAHITSAEIAIRLGPYQLVNALSMSSGRPAMILRVEHWGAHENAELELPRMDKTHDDYYHGGSESDEIAALLSLCLGIRVKAGGATRVFGRGGDPMGMPIGYIGAEDPILPSRKNGPSRSILNSTLGQHSLDDARMLAIFPLVTPENAIALVRAARMYQEAIWIIDDTPELSWIMLTSAIETVAHQWRRQTESAVEKMRTSKPRLEIILRKYAKKRQADRLVNEVAEEIAPYMGATKTFIDFIIEFMPPPPSVRPAEWAQFSWKESSVKKALNKIYDYRSKALHGGKPFPAPMCEPPVPMGDHGEYTEVPAGLAAMMKGSVWVLKDTPMLLNTFEHIVRHTILNWWKSVAPGDKN